LFKETQGVDKRKALIMAVTPDRFARAMARKASWGFMLVQGLMHLYELLYEWRKEWSDSLKQPTNKGD